MSKSSKKRFLSLFLALTMLVSLSPAIYAEGETEQEEVSLQTEDQLELVEEQSPVELPEEPAHEEQTEESSAVDIPSSETEPAGNSESEEVSDNSENTALEDEEKVIEEAEQEKTEEKTEEEKKEDEEKKVEEEKISLTKVTFVSTQEIELTLNSSIGAVQPATEMDIAYYFSTLDNSSSKPMAEPAVEEVTEPAVEEVTEPAVEEVTEPAVEEAAEPAVEEVTEPAVEEVAEPAVEEVAEPAAEEAAEPVEEESAEESAEIVFTAVYILQPGIYSYSAYAEKCIGIKDVSVEITENSTEKNIEIKLDELPYGFKGMPAGYELSKEEIAEKKKLEDNNVVSTLSSLAPGINYVEDEVMFLSEDEEYVNMVAEAYSAELKKFSYGVAVIKLQTATVLEAVTVAADPDMPLPAVEPNYTRQEPTLPGSGRRMTLNSAQGFGEVPQLQSWKLWLENTDNPDQYLKDPTDWNYQYYHDIVNTYEAWGVTTGAGVKVAVVDTGVVDNPDLAPFNLIEITDPIDSHGTHVAGIIAARMGNGVGGAGVAPDATILSVPIFHWGAYGPTYDSADLVMGINAVCEFSDASIMNMSIGGVTYSAIEETALRKAVESGITVVVSMGNYGTNIKSYPAAYNIPGLIAVGSTTESGAASVFSNYGPWQDVAAPGSDIISTMPGDAYGFMSGTSMAAPVVSGVCALYMSAYGNPGPAAMEKIIRSATTNGVIDASKLFIKDTTAPEISIAVSGTAEYGSNIEIIAPANRNTDYENCAIVYTIDGKTPSIKEGKVQGTTRVYDESAGIDVNSENGFVPGKKMTIKAACVSGMGVLSKVVSKTFTVGYADADYIEIVNLPDHIVSGKDLKLEFKVYPEEAEQKIIWEKLSNDGCPGTNIEVKTNTIKTSANDEGLVQFRAKSSDGIATYDLDVYVQKALPVYKLTLDTTKVTLNHLDADNTYGYPLTPYAYDKNGDVIDCISYQWKSSNEKVAKVDEWGYVTSVGKGSATISCTALDGSKKVAKATVTVKQLVTGITITGQGRIAPGKYTTYKATVTPANANNKKVSWSLGNAPDDVTVSSSGRVTVPKGTAIGASFIICASATDGSNTYKDLYVDIDALVNKISIRDSGYLGEITYDTYGAVKSATLWNLKTPYWDGSENTKSDNEIQLYAEVEGPANYSAPLLWSSSNTKVATVEYDDGTGIALVHAVAPGSATITCKAQDGSGKSASMKVNVVIPASGITVVSGSKATFLDNYKILAAGKSVTNKAVLSSAFGKPTISKVFWDYGVRVYNKTADEIDDNRISWIEYDIYNNKMASVSSSGTLSAKSSISYYAKEYKVVLDVYAVTTDGTNLWNSVAYRISPALITKLSVGYFFPIEGFDDHGKPIIVQNGIGGYPFRDEDDNDDNIDGYAFNFSGTQVTSGTVTWSAGRGGIEIDVPISVWRNDAYIIPISDCIVKSSNPNVASAVYVDQNADKESYDCFRGIVIYTNDEGITGTAKITVTATDGSNKSCSVTVKLTK